MLNQRQPWRSVDQRLWWKLQAQKFNEQVRLEELARNFGYGEKALGQDGIQSPLRPLQQAWQQAVEQAQPAQQEKKSDWDRLLGNIKSFDIDDAAMDVARIGGKAAWNTAIKPALKVLDAPAEYAVQPFVGTILNPYTTQKIDPVTGKPYRVVDWKRLLDDMTAVDEGFQSLMKGDIIGAAKGFVMPFTPQSAPALRNAAASWVTSLWKGDFKETWAEGRKTWKETIEENPILQREAPGLIIAAEMLTDPTMYIGPGALKTAATKLPKAAQLALGGKVGIKLIDEFFSTPAAATLGMMIASPAATQIAHELDLPEPLKMIAPLAGGFAGAGFSSKLAGAMAGTGSIKGQELDDLVQRLRALRNPEALAMQRVSVAEYAAAKEQLEKAILALSEGRPDKAAIIPPASRIDQLYDEVLAEMFGGSATSVTGDALDRLKNEVLMRAAKEQYGENIPSSVLSTLNKRMQKKLSVWGASGIDWQLVTEKFGESASWYRFYTDVSAQLAGRGIPRDMVDALIAVGGWNRGPAQGLSMALNTLTAVIDMTSGGKNWDALYGAGFTAMKNAGEDIPDDMIIAASKRLMDYLKENGMANIISDHAEAQMRLIAGMNNRFSGMKFKLASFHKNISDARKGAVSPEATIDVHMVRPLGFPSVDSSFGKVSSLESIDYLFLNRHLAHVAAEVGITPAELQASFWSAWRLYSDRLSVAYANARKAAGLPADPTIRDLEKFAIDNGMTFERFLAEADPQPGYSMREIVTSVDVLNASARLRMALRKQYPHRLMADWEAGRLLPAETSGTKVIDELIGPFKFGEYDVSALAESAPYVGFTETLLRAAEDAKELGIDGSQLKALADIGIPHTVSVGSVDLMKYGINAPNVTIRLDGRNALHAKHAAGFLAERIKAVTGQQAAGVVVARSGQPNAIAVNIRAADDLDPSVIGEVIANAKGGFAILRGNKEVELIFKPEDVASAQSLIDEVARRLDPDTHSVAIEAVNTAVVAEGQWAHPKQAFEALGAIQESFRQTKQSLAQQAAAQRAAAAQAAAQQAAAQQAADAAAKQAADAAAAASPAASTPADVVLPLERHAERSPHTAVATAKKLQMSRVKREFYESLPAELRAIDGMATFVASLPEWVLQRLEVVKGGDAAGSVVATYNPKTAVLTISSDVLTGKVDDPLGVVMHEVAHHIESFFTDEELEALGKLWQREMKRGGWQRAKKYADAVEQGVEGLPLAVRQQLDMDYRYAGGFREWLAEKMVDYFTGRPVDVPRGSALERVTDLVRSIVLSIASAMRLTDRPQKFEDIVKQMLEADFRRSIANRAIEEFPYRKADRVVKAGQSAPAAALPSIVVGKLPKEAMIPGTKVAKTTALEFEPDVEGKFGSVRQPWDFISVVPEEYEKIIPQLEEMAYAYKFNGFPFSNKTQMKIAAKDGVNITNKELTLLFWDALSDYMPLDTYLGGRYAFELMPENVFNFYFEKDISDFDVYATQRPDPTGKYLRLSREGERARELEFVNRPKDEPYYIAINKRSFSPEASTTRVDLMLHEMAHAFAMGFQRDDYEAMIRLYENVARRADRWVMEAQRAGGYSRAPGLLEERVGRFVYEVAKDDARPIRQNLKYVGATPDEMFAELATVPFWRSFQQEVVASTLWNRLTRHFSRFAKPKQSAELLFKPFAKEAVEGREARWNAFSGFSESKVLYDRIADMYTGNWQEPKLLIQSKVTGNAQRAFTGILPNPPVFPGEELLPMRKLSAAPQPKVDTNDLFNLPAPDQLAAQMGKRTKGMEGAFRSALAKVPLVSKLDPNITRDSQITPFAIDARNSVWNMIDAWESYADFLWGKLEDSGVTVEFRDNNFWLNGAPAGDVFEAALGADRGEAAARAAAALTDGQKAVINEIAEFNKRVNSTLVKYAQPDAADAVAEKVRSGSALETQYFPRIVAGVDGKPKADFTGVTSGAPAIGTGAHPLEDRAYMTMFEGQDTLKINYADPEQAFRSMVRAKLAAAGAHYIAGALKRVGISEDQVRELGGIPGVTHYDLGQYIPALSGVYFTEEQATRILAALRGRPGFEARAIRELNSLLTPIRAMGDISWLGQQGAYVLFRHPFKSVKTAIKVIISSLGKPEVYRQLMMDEIARGAARVGMSEQEYFTLLVTNGLHQVADDLGEIGIGYTSTSGLAGWRHYKRFSNETFGRFLNWARIALANDVAERAAKTGRWDELAGAIAAVNRATGWTGRRPTSLESLVMFAPRFLSAAVEQTLAAVTKGGLEGSVARRHLATLLGTSAIMAIGINALRGYDTETDPRSPNFLRIRNVGGLDVSLLGTYNTLFRTLARVSTGDRQALTQFMEGKLSPAVAMIYFPARGRTYLGEPIGLDDPANLVYQYGKTMVPFPVQALIEEGVEPAIEERSVKPLLEALPNQIASGTGFASTPMTPAERRDLAREGARGGVTFGDKQLVEGPVQIEGKAEEMFGAPYDELTASQKAEVNRDPEVKKWIEEAEKNVLTRSDPFAQYTKQRMEAAAQLEALGQRLMRGEISGNEYRQRYRIIQSELAGARQALGIKSKGVVGEWYALYEKAQLPDGSVDYDKLEQLQAEFREKHPDIDERLAKEVGVRDDEVQALYRKAQKEMAEYQKIPIYLGMSAKASRRAVEALQQAQAMVAFGQAPSVRDALRMLVPRLGEDAYLAMYALRTKANPAREQYRRAHPLLALFYSEAGAHMPLSRYEAYAR